MGVRRPLSNRAPLGCAAAPLGPAAGLQRAAVDRAGRSTLAPAAARVSALAHRLPANTPLAGGHFVLFAGLMFPRFLYFLCSP